MVLKRHGLEQIIYLANRRDSDIHRQPQCAIHKNRKVTLTEKTSENRNDVVFLAMKISTLKNFSPRWIKRNTDAVPLMIV